MKRKLFCELGPWAYRISTEKMRLLRRLQNVRGHMTFARTRTSEKLPVVIYRHTSLIRRRLGNVNMQLQENKAVNLRIAAPKITGVIIHPGETFSFWELVGSTSARKGYREGLTIANGETTSGIGGGMCQMTNLIHWMVLHTPMTIVEHHHHDGMDLFPDYGRQIPFGTGTSIVYNYLDYRFRNDTEQDFQLILWVDDTYLHGELRSNKPLPVKYHIHAQDERFVEEDGIVYREGKVIRRCVDVTTGNTLSMQCIRENHARVYYDTSNLNIERKPKSNHAKEGI